MGDARSGHGRPPRARRRPAATTDKSVSSTPARRGSSARPGAGGRRRRSAAEARREILDAAERRLLAEGPDALRLQDVAADVGVAHPTILYHFQSRARLVEAVIDRALDALLAELVASVAAPGGEVDVAELLERTERTLAGGGAARLGAWLLLTQQRGRGRPRGPTLLRDLARAVHARRNRAARQGLVSEASYEDAVFRVLLGAAALFGDALAGAQLRASAGLADDPAAARRFRSWLARILVGALPAAEPEPGRRRPRS
jgi:AcrR family transcriptional regulator